ncbi:MAG: N-acetylmuramoyl-L-alanine amidase [Merismopedia sp. SIO2A8]|nr:N-acetylmuramoyl-L-alanine amidase [Merismopedia sp. SIO2A8]
MRTLQFLLRKSQGFRRWMVVGILAMAIALIPLHSYSASIRQLFSTTGDFPLSAGYSPLTTGHSPLAPERTLLATGYAPFEEVAPADPTNYGSRYLTDIEGNPVNNAMIVVLHETVGSATSAINTMQTPHTNENLQVSYHSIIRRNGTIVHLVHPQMRAFGAGNSVFDGPNGAETVRTHPSFPGSVNNFAYHTSLETPSDGRGNQRRHSGYTEAQYQSLAWLIAHLPVPDNRITTHKAVDQSNSRQDPRSFDRQKFIQLLHTYERSFDVITE